jgi:hypothetical protein
MKHFIASLSVFLASCGSAGSWDGGDWKDRVDPNFEYASIAWQIGIPANAYPTPGGNAGVMNFGSAPLTSVEFRDANGTIATFQTFVQQTELWESPLSLPDGNYLVVARSSTWTYAKWWILTDGAEAVELDNGDVFFP